MSNTNIKEIPYYDVTFTNQCLNPFNSLIHTVLYDSDKHSLVDLHSFESKKMLGICCLDTDGNSFGWFKNESNAIDINQKYYLFSKEITSSEWIIYNWRLYHYPTIGFHENGYLINIPDAFSITSTLNCHFASSLYLNYSHPTNPVILSKEFVSFPYYHCPDDIQLVKFILYE